MTETNELRTFIFQKQMPNDDIYFYEEQFLLDVVSGIEESVCVKLIGVQKKGSHDIISVCPYRGAPKGTMLKAIKSSDSQIVELIPQFAPPPAERPLKTQAELNARIEQEFYRTMNHEINVDALWANDYANTARAENRNPSFYNVTASMSSSVLSSAEKRLLTKSSDKSNFIWQQVLHNPNPTVPLDNVAAYAGNQARDRQLRAINHIVSRQSNAPRAPHSHPAQASYMPAHSASGIVPHGYHDVNGVEAQQSFNRYSTRGGGLSTTRDAQASQYYAIADKSPAAAAAEAAGVPLAKAAMQNAPRPRPTQSTIYGEPRAYLAGQDSRVGYVEYSNPVLEGQVNFGDFSTPQDRFIDERKTVRDIPTAGSVTTPSRITTSDGATSSSAAASSRVSESRLPTTAPADSSYKLSDLQTSKVDRADDLYIEDPAFTPDGKQVPYHSEAPFSGQADGNEMYAYQYAPGNPARYETAQEAAYLAREQEALQNRSYEAWMRYQQHQARLRQQSRLNHLQITNNVSLDPNFEPTDSHRAFADSRAAYHQAYSHQFSVSRYAYGADFAEEEQKLVNEAREAKRQQLEAERVRREDEALAAAQAAQSHLYDKQRTYPNSRDASTYVTRGNNPDLSDFHTPQDYGYQSKAHPKNFAPSGVNSRAYPKSNSSEVETYVHDERSPYAHIGNIAEHERSAPPAIATPRHYADGKACWWREPSHEDAPLKKAAPKQPNRVNQGFFIGTPETYLPESQNRGPKHFITPQSTLMVAPSSRAASGVDRLVTDANRAAAAAAVGATGSFVSDKETPDVVETTKATLPSEHAKIEITETRIKNKSKLSDNSQASEGLGSDKDLESVVDETSPATVNGRVPAYTSPATVVSSNGEEINELSSLVPENDSPEDDVVTRISHSKSPVHLEEQNDGSHSDPAVFERNTLISHNYDDSFGDFKPANSGGVGSYISDETINEVTEARMVGTAPTSSVGIVFDSYMPKTKARDRDLAKSYARSTQAPKANPTVAPVPPTYEDDLRAYDRELGADDNEDYDLELDDGYFDPNAEIDTTSTVMSTGDGSYSPIGGVPAPSRYAFGDFKTADGSVVEPMGRIPVMSRKEQEARRREEAMARETERIRKLEERAAKEQMLQDLSDMIHAEANAARDVVEVAREHDRALAELESSYQDSLSAAKDQISTLEEKEIILAAAQESANSDHLKELDNAVVYREKNENKLKHAEDDFKSSVSNLVGKSTGQHPDKDLHAATSAAPAPVANAEQETMANGGEPAATTSGDALAKEQGHAQDSVEVKSEDTAAYENESEVKTPELQSSDDKSSYDYKAQAEDVKSPVTESHNTLATEAKDGSEPSKSVEKGSTDPKSKVQETSDNTIVTVTSAAAAAVAAAAMADDVNATDSATVISSHDGVLEQGLNSDKKDNDLSSSEESHKQNIEGVGEISDNTIVETTSQDSPKSDDTYAPTETVAKSDNISINEQAHEYAPEETSKNSAAHVEAEALEHVFEQVADANHAYEAQGQESGEAYDDLNSSSDDSFEDENDLLATDTFGGEYNSHEEAADNENLFKGDELDDGASDENHADLESIFDDVTNDDHDADDQELSKSDDYELSEEDDLAEYSADDAHANNANADPSYTQNYSSTPAYETVNTKTVEETQPAENHQYAQSNQYDEHAPYAEHNQYAHDSSTVESSNATPATDAVHSEDAQSDAELKSEAEESVNNEANSSADLDNTENAQAVAPREAQEDSHNAKDSVQSALASEAPAPLSKGISRNNYFDDFFSSSLSPYNNGSSNSYKEKEIVVNASYSHDSIDDIAAQLNSSKAGSGLRYNSLDAVSPSYKPLSDDDAKTVELSNGVSEMNDLENAESDLKKIHEKDEYAPHDEDIHEPSMESNLDNSAEAQEISKRAEKTREENAYYANKEAEVNKSSEGLVRDNSGLKDVLFAAPTRFVEPNKTETHDSEDDAAKAVQAAVADVIEGSMESYDLDDATEEHNEKMSYMHTSTGNTKDKSKGNLASLAAELIDDFDDPFADSFADGMDDDFDSDRVTNNRRS